MNNLVLLQQAAGGGGSSWFTLVFFGGMIAVMYFFMIRPQQKKAKDAQKFRDALKKGDNVVTIGGLHGTISAIEDTTIVLDVDRGVKLTFDKSSISAEYTKKVATK